METVNLTDFNDRLAAATHKAGGTPAFELRNWTCFLDSRKREVMSLRFIEEWALDRRCSSYPGRHGTVESVQRKEKAGAVF